MKIDDVIYTQFAKRFGQDRALRNVPMRAHTSFRTGGEAGLMILPASQEEAAAAAAMCQRLHLSWRVIGNGTNLLVKDEGFDGVIIKLGSFFSRISVDAAKAQIRAQAGALLAAVARAAMESGLDGLVFAGGIPGSVGGGTLMNAGAYGCELKDVIHEITYLSEKGTIETISASEAGFSYRSSLFQEQGGVILETLFQLRQGERQEIERQMKELTAKRNAKQPVHLPSAGSTFKRPQGYYAGQLIEEAGLKGAAVGGAAVSQMHAGFIVNEGGATSGDILDLIKLVQDTVFDQFGVMLEPEVKIL